MNTYKAIRSLRAIRYFQQIPIKKESIDVILNAGRLTGSQKNRQPWNFILIQDRIHLVELASCARYASHIKDAMLAVVLVLEEGWFCMFDAGRAAQNMMLAAWEMGIGSCMGTLQDADKVKRLLKLPSELNAPAAISFGFPVKDPPQLIEGKPREQILARLGRKPMAEIIHMEKW